MNDYKNNDFLRSLSPLLACSLIDWVSFCCWSTSWRDEIVVVSRTSSVVLGVESNCAVAILPRTWERAYTRSFGMGLNVIWKQIFTSIPWKKHYCWGLHSQDLEPFTIPNFQQLRYPIFQQIIARPGTGAGLPCSLVTVTGLSWPAVLLILYPLHTCPIHVYISIW